ncbi:PIN domain-containing protein [Streptacidiphilus griseoplanus]|uniref:PIN domain-containing protein n=1 Tax=Peterkaempfera griseoplana TaxID=66896 RepID=UPI0007C72665|nr:PIN domain-containing protein [Peterkaempfera griseoplana]
MLITCRPGTHRDNLRRDVAHVGNEIGNLRGAHFGSAHDRLLAYLGWANEAVRLLGTQISDSDLRSLVLTPRYDALLAGAADLGSGTTGPLLNGLLNLEMGQRYDDFEAALKALDQQIERWSRPGVFVVADSSFYCRHEDKLEEVDFAKAIGVREEKIHLLVPMVIVDELDGLKQKGQEQTRWRAGYTLAVLDRVLQNPNQPARLRDEDFSALDHGGIPRGEITVELVFDPPGHSRLPIEDEEIIARALAVQSLAGRPVTLVTFDTGQSMRARQAGLRVVKLTTPQGEEPAKQERAGGGRRRGQKEPTATLVEK